MTLKSDNQILCASKKSTGCFLFITAVGCITLYLEETCNSMLLETSVNSTCLSGSLHYQHAQFSTDLQLKGRHFVVRLLLRVFF
jgi:hypothetical protein